MSLQVPDTKIDIHKGDKRNISARRRLETSMLPKKDKEAIVNFISTISAAENLSPAREAKFIDELRTIRLSINKDFLKLDKQDIQNYILDLNKSQLAPTTQADYRKHIKRFIRWLWIENGRYEDDGNRSYPKIISWIHDPRKETNRNGIIREVLLEEVDVLKIINSCKLPMWKALMWILWEAGLRPGELLNLRVRDIEPTEHGIRVNVRFGKTGARKLPLVQAKQSVLIWLDLHPQKGQPDALLFPITYTRTLIHVNEIAQRTGIVGKKTGLKYWRKARATFLAKFMTQNQLMYWFGWCNPGTSTAYVFASEKDIIPTILKLNNIAKVEPDGTVVKFRVCIKCSERNDEDKTNCMRCAHPLTPQALEKLEDENRKIIREEVLKAFSLMKSLPEERGKSILEELEKRAIEAKF